MALFKPCGVDKEWNKVPLHLPWLWSIRETCVSKIKIPLLYALNYCLFSVRKNVTIIVYHGPSRFFDETLQSRPASLHMTGLFTMALRGQALRRFQRLGLGSVYNGIKRSDFEEVPVARVRVRLPWHQEVRLWGDASGWTLMDPAGSGGCEISTSKQVLVAVRLVLPSRFWWLWD